MSRVNRYVAVMVMAALALLATHTSAALLHDWGHLVAWIVICLVSETMWSNNLTGTATVAMSATAGLSALALWGTGAGMWVSMLSTLIADLFVLRKPWIRAVFNAAQITVTAFFAGSVFELLGARHALPAAAGGAALDRHAATGLVLPFIALCAVYFVFNRALVARAVAWASERRWWEVVRNDWLYLARLEVDAASFLLVPLMVISYTAVGYPGVLLFYAPLFMLYQSDLRYFELKRAEAENLRNAKFGEQVRIAKRVAHDLNNRLTPIFANAQMLISDAGSSKFEQVAKRAEKILAEGKNIREMAKGLTDYTQTTIATSPMDLNALLMSAMEIVKDDQRLVGVEWDVRLDPKLPTVSIDERRMQDVFINMFLNAGDAMLAQETRKLIAVSTRLDADGARVEVIDSGPGIPAEVLPRMFEVMFTTKKGGHGLGLSNSYRTIELHGGKLTVESPEGSGAQFHIQLPLSGPADKH